MSKSKKYSCWLLENLNGIVVARFRYEKDAIRAQKLRVTDGYGPSVISYVSGSKEGIPWILK